MALACSATYGQTDTTRHKYNLSNPVPRDRMKDMETDRPDVTESAYTVEAGHFQVESDLFKQARNKSNGVQSIQNAYNVANFKLGITENMDIQLVVPTYVTTTVKDVANNRVIDKTSGFDDLTLRVKYNLWGNAGGNTAFAILPYITLPTSSFQDNGIQGGVVLPFALKLSEKLNLGTQVGVGVVKEEDNRRYTEFLYSLTFGRSIFKQLDCFVEGAAIYNSYQKNTDTYANGGLIFSVTNNFNIDAGLNYGLNKQADKVYFVGFSLRY